MKGFVAATLLLLNGLVAAVPTPQGDVQNTDIVLLVSPTDVFTDNDGVQIFGQGNGVCNPSSIHVKGFQTARFAEIVNDTNEAKLVKTCRAWQHANCTGASSTFGQNVLTAIADPIAGNVGSYSCP